MRGYLKRGFKIIITKGDYYSVVKLEEPFTMPELLSFEDFLSGKEGYAVWSDRKQSLVFKGKPLKYTGKIILKNENIIQDEV